MNMKEIILNVLFPKLCVNCGKEGDYICNKCDLFISESILICPVCGNSSPSGETHSNCVNKYGLDGLISIWDYDGLVKKLIYKVKYDNVTDIITMFIKKTFGLIAKDHDRFSTFLSFVNSSNTHITYVPMYVRRAKRRGFNQSEIIARQIGSIFCHKRVKLLNRLINTKSQTGLDKKERLQNIKDSFVLNRDKHISRNVLLIDDIFTTGATMHECCKILKQAGAQRVWGFTLAKTL